MHDGVGEPAIDQKLFRLALPHLQASAPGRRGRDLVTPTWYQL
jgi:hypothetical protein